MCQVVPFCLFSLYGPLVHFSVVTHRTTHVRAIQVGLCPSTVCHRLLLKIATHGRLIAALSRLPALQSLVHGESSGNDNARTLTTVSELAALSSQLSRTVRYIDAWAVQWQAVMRGRSSRHPARVGLLLSCISLFCLASCTLAWKNASDDEVLHVTPASFSGAPGLPHSAATLGEQRR